MKEQLNVVSRRFFCSCLALVMVLSLIPNFKINAYAESGDNTTADAGGFISMRLIHMYGDQRRQIIDDSSTTATVTLDGNDNPVPDKSTTSVNVEIRFIDQTTGAPVEKDIYYAIRDGRPNDEPQKDHMLVPKDGIVPIQLWQVKKSGDVIFITANTADGKNYSVRSIDYSELHEAGSNTRYARYGMQVRIINDEYLGYDQYPLSTSNAGGDFAGIGPKEGYTGLDGKHKDSCWFDIQTCELDDLAADGKIINIDYVQDWLDKYYVPILEAKGKQIPESVVVSGPAYIVAYNGEANNPQIIGKALLDYYDQTDSSHAANKLAGWGENTRNDFYRLRYMSMAVPLKQKVQGVQVNCIDIDTGKTFYEKKISVDETIKVYDDEAVFTKVFYENDDAPYMQFLNNLRNAITVNGSMDTFTALYTVHSTLWDTLRSYERDAVTGQLVKNENDVFAQLGVINTLHQQTLKDLDRQHTTTDIGRASVVKHVDFNTDVIGSNAVFKDYTLDHGFAYDSLFPQQREQATPILSDDKDVDVLITQVFRMPQIDLYFKNTSNNTIKVKVRINGTIDETMTREYPIRFNDKGEAQPIPANDPYIEQSKNLLPPGSTVKKIVQGPDEKPMPLVPDPKKPDDNVVIIDAEGAGYTVKIRINDVIDESLSRTYPITYDGSGNPNPVFDSDPTVEQSKALVPSSATIKKIVQGETESALPLNPDPNNPSKNVIIIDCEGEDESSWTYRVEHYKDNVLVETETVEGGPTGTVVEHGSVKNYPGYVFQREEGVPLVLENNNGVIKVFYKKQVEGGTASSNVKLYTDEYRTEVKNITYKSGYGFYAEYYVDVPSWFGNYVLKYGVNATGLTDDMYTQRWSYCAGGDPGRAAWTSTDHNMYRVNNWDVKATWVDGANSEKGKNVTVSVKSCLNKAKSTSTKLCFTLPRNNDSAQKLAKAYIPVATKDGNSWRVSFTFSCNYEYRTFWTTPYTHGSHCPGHTRTTRFGSYTWYHTGSHTMYEPHQQWNRASMSGSGYASVKINGSMYEDDFTGDRDKRGGR